MAKKVVFRVKVHGCYDKEENTHALCNKVYHKLLLAAVPINPEPVRVDVNSGETIKVVFDVPEQSTPMQIQKIFAKYWNDHIDPIFKEEHGRYILAIEVI